MQTNVEPEMKRKPTIKQVNKNVFLRRENIYKWIIGSKVIDIYISIRETQTSLAT